MITAVKIACLLIAFWWVHFKMPIPGDRPTPTELIAFEGEENPEP